MQPQSDFHYKITMWAWQGKTKQKGYYVSTNIKIKKNYKFVARKKLKHWQRQQHPTNS